MTVTKTHHRHLLSSAMRLLFVDPDPRRHTVLEFRILCGIKTNLHVKLIRWPLIGNVEHDVAGSRGGTHLIHDPLIRSRTECVHGECGGVPPLPPPQTLYFPIIPLP